MELRPGYKQTEIGIIPSDWIVSPVGHEFSVQLGKMLDSEKNVGVLKPYLGNRAVQWGRVDLTELSSVRMTPADLKRFRLQKGDLLVCEGGEVGRAAIWEGAVSECYYQKALHRLRPTRGYSVKLMVNVLHHLASRGVLLNFVTQTSIAHLPKDKFETVPIPLPPTKAEQEAIAEALSDADALIESLEQLIAKKRQIKQGVMQELLTGKKRLPGFTRSDKYTHTELGNIPNDWSVVPLGDLGKFKNGINKNSESFGHGSPFVNLMDVFGVSSISSPDTLGLVASNPVEQHNYDLRKGDVIFIRSSVKPSGVGLTAVVEEDLSKTVYSGFLIRFRDSGSLSHNFKRHCFNEEGFRTRLIGASSVSANTNINQDSLRRLNLILPATKAEQEAIAAIPSSMDAEILALQAKLFKVLRIKQGMTQELLTGRIRLV
jgi:type I restriction enzyme, S subunit